MASELNEQHPDYPRMARAIAYMQAHYHQQPSLEQIAASVPLSPFHFQRQFKLWAGVSPKKFIQFLSLQQAKAMLNKNASVMETSHATGLSGSGRLHDLFVGIEGMTPGEYKNGGAALTIHYQFADSLFGQVLIASTDKGICHLHFAQGTTQALDDLRAAFPNAKLLAGNDDQHQRALALLNQPAEQWQQIRLHVKATDFQLKVWQGLLDIPAGQLRSYGSLASALQQPQAARAVGTAIGRNPVAYIIPCHRVIQASGETGGYRWGGLRKSAMIAREAAQHD